MVAWAKMQDQQMLTGLMMGMSVFALVVVYLGGRSNHRRFNDRTIDSINLLYLGVFFSVTALLRAVLFSFDWLQLVVTNEYLNEDTNPLLIL